MEATIINKCWKCDKSYDDCVCTETCDKWDCKVKCNPKTKEEFEEGFYHWRDHGYLSGCSHGC